MMTLRMNSRLVLLSALLALGGCEGSKDENMVGDEPSMGGSVAGSTGGAPSDPEGGGAAGGEIAGGEEGGGEEGAGEEGGGDEGGGEEVGLFDPSTPLPTPQETTLPAPEGISTPREGAPNPDCNGSWVEEARGWVVDELGQALVGAKVQLCVRVADTGALLCLMPSDTLADGSFSITVPSNAQCMADATFRSIVPSDKFTTAYCHIELSNVDEDGALRILEPLVLYQTRPAVNKERSGEVLSSEYEGGATVSFNPDDVYSRDPENHWGRSLPPDVPGLCFLKEEGPQVDGVFGFAPEGDVTGSNASVKISNEMGYEPMSSVALYALGNLDCTVLGQDEGIDEGDWVQVGVATVDASGMWIEAGFEQGLPCLSWFGYGPLP